MKMSFATTNALSVGLRQENLLCLENKSSSFGFIILLDEINGNTFLVRCGRFSMTGVVNLWAS